MDLFARNNAPSVNPNIVNGQTVAIAQTVRGSDLYYAICAAMGFTALSIWGLSLTKPRTHRIFFYMCSGLCMVACIAYFAMGSNLGWTPIDVEFVRNDPIVRGRNRQIMYVRYIDWVITTPLLLMDLLLTAGMPWPTILYVVGLDEIMIVTGLVGALVRTRYKWGFYAFGCAAMLGIFYELAITARKHAKVLGNDVHRVFFTCGVLTLVVWLCYPIAWGLCEGGNVIAPDSEAIFYGVLDFLAKPCFSIALIAGHWNIDPARLGLSIKDFSAEDTTSHRQDKKNDDLNEKSINNSPNVLTNGHSTIPPVDTGRETTNTSTGYTGVPVHETESRNRAAAHNHQALNGEHAPYYDESTVV